MIKNIDETIINKIFNLELKLKEKKDKIKLSEYEQSIPMFDIYSLGIYPVINVNIHTRLSDSHYRFVNDEIFNWMKNMLEKNIDDEKKERLKKNLKILENYDLDILYNTSINAFFKYSPKFGLDVSICKRNSFHPLFRHISPYYTRSELIKLGSNMNLINEKDINRLELLDKNLHYKLCKTISKNDIDFETIKIHSNLILKNNGISAVNYYSLIGSFLINNSLRKNQIDKLNKINFNYLKKMVTMIKQSPPFEKNYYFYRFIWDDIFLKNLNIGDILIDKGFMSCTRDPFYAPGLEKSFGLILMKINIPKNIKGLCLFIENYSLFKSEEEVILAPNSKLKLISKDDNFKYYHINPKFEKLIDKKYEFELIGNDELKLIGNDELKLDGLKVDELKLIINDDLKLSSDIMYNRLKELMSKTGGYFKIGGNYIYGNWFDSGSSYSDFYYNKNDKGVLFSIYEDDNLVSSIECGRIMVINYVNKFIYGKTRKIYDLYFIMGKILGYHNALIYQNYHNFILENSENDIFRTTEKYNYDLYNYFKTDKYELNNYEKYEYGLIRLKNFGERPINDKLSNKEDILIKDLYVDIIENRFELYPNLEKLLNNLINLDNLDIFNTTNLDIYSYWQSKNIEINNYQEGYKLEDNYSVIFNRKRYR